MVNKFLRISSIQLLQDIWFLLSARKRFQVYSLLAVMLLGLIAEITTLASILPLISVFVNPDVVLDKFKLLQLPITNSVANIEQLRLVISILFIISVLISGLVRLLNLWLNGRVTASITSEFSSQYFLKILSQPYSYHLDHNSGNTIAAMTLLITATSGVLYSCLQFITAFLISISLCFTLLVINPSVTMSLVVIFSTLYLIFSAISSKKLNSNSKTISVLSRKQVTCLQEGLGSIRDVIIDSRQNQMLHIYQNIDLPLRLCQAENVFLGTFPKFAIESFALIVLCLTAYFLTSNTDNQFVIPTLGLIAVASQRLLPTFQALYANWSGIQANYSQARSVLDILLLPQLKIESISSKNAITLQNKLVLQKISFSYIKSKQVFSNLSLTIRKGERIGLIGETGSGKSTLIDIILGLLNISDGSFFVDDYCLSDPINNKLLLARWRYSISHVPQNIVLTDSSILENIAFGIPKYEIDYNLVVNCAKVAQLNCYIESTPLGYETLVGEQGLKLSGGQKQRIGIARALYKKSDIIVLDEATSALDNETESIVMSNINHLKNNPTMIIIAHRLSTLSSCDYVYKLHKGILENVTETYNITDLNQGN